MRKKKDSKLLFKINKEITFIVEAVKPFEKRQDLFLLASAHYLDAIKKSLSNISQLCSFLSLKCSDFCATEEMGQLIEWGNKVAQHLDLVEENPFGETIDELEIGKLWDAFHINNGKKSLFLRVLLINISCVRFEVVI